MMIRRNRKKIKRMSRRGRKGGWKGYGGSRGEKGGGKGVEEITFREEGKSAVTLQSQMGKQFLLILNRGDQGLRPSSLLLHLLHLQHPFLHLLEREGVGETCIAR